MLLRCQTLATCLLLCLPALSAGGGEKPDSLGHFDSLRTLDGQEFKNVRVRRIDPDGLSVFHSRGAAKIPFLQLPEDIRFQFGFDAEKAKEYAAARAARRKRYEESRPARELAQRRRKIENRIAALSADIESMEAPATESARNTHKVDPWDPWAEPGVFPVDEKDENRYWRAVEKVNQLQHELAAIRKEEALLRLRAAHGAVFIRGKVLQVLKQGVLLSAAQTGDGESWSDASDVVFVYDNPGRFADGDDYSAVVRERGFYEYASVLGAIKKVRAFTTGEASVPDKAATTYQGQQQ